ncbi:ATP-dependent endonuclease [Kribbella sancticallisti]|uniref:ATP-dependent endonuclease n=1 Tax=Kribbella sancticallisti TaxID=460087 RepID=A0ABN2EEM7_9ACTN
MHLQSFAVRNFRRLRRITVDLDDEATIFVGANNSGKTSAMHIFQYFLTKGVNFGIHDFSAACWQQFNEYDPAVEGAALPDITLDLWFDVDEANLHRVIDLLPDLEWEDSAPVGIRLSFDAKDPADLNANYLAMKDEPGQWPEDLHDYLRKRLGVEYHVVHYKLDRRQFDDQLLLKPGQTLQVLEKGTEILRSIIKVDLLHAQRHLADTEQRGRDEDLSRTLGRYYQSYLEKPDPAQAPLQALADTEVGINKHFNKVFGPIVTRLNKLGYPGIDNPDLMVKTELRGETLMNTSAQVHYVVPGAPAGQPAITLPDRYNGLGFKNLIYMVVEIVAAHEARKQMAEGQPPVHLIMVEEPESHLHAQLQQVFIRQLKSIIDDVEDPGTQFVLTTHSSHIVYEDFSSIRYFARVRDKDTFRYSDVRDLSVFSDEVEADTRKFLLQYLKLTHCDLFFADAAILVEGNVERLLVPLIIAQFCDRLATSHLTILELGGAFAHRFRKLVEFLGLHCLVITDIDSISGPPKAREACTTDEPGAITANQTLIQWLPAEESIEKLLELEPEKKEYRGGPGKATVRVAYQTPHEIAWNGEKLTIAGRTFEEALAFENLSWSQDDANKSLRLKVKDPADLEAVVQGVFERVRTLDKTKFALTLIEREVDWTCPSYITEGLDWLADEICDLDVPPSVVPTEEVTDESSD